MWRARASQGAVDERAVLLAQADSLFATLEAIGRRDTRISGALDGAKAETARLRSRIRRAPRDQQVLAPLRDSLDRLSTSFGRLAAAAALDAQQIARTNEPALALVEATYEDGTRRVASAFSARRSGGSLVYVTVQDLLLRQRRASRRLHHGAANGERQAAAARAHSPPIARSMSRSSKYRAAATPARPRRWRRTWAVRWSGRRR